jgi:peptidyl-prolyl cis-trans isomerase SurA
VVASALVIIPVAEETLDAQNAQEQLVDRVVATVNDSPVLHSEIKSKIDRGQSVIISSHPAKEEASEFEKALQDQINFELILQKVDELELTVDESQIESEIKTFIKNRNMSLDELKQALQQQGMTYAQYKEDFADQMIIRKFQGRVINPLIKVTDKDLESYYLKRVGSTSENVTLNLRQIYIMTPPDATPVVVDGKRKRAREVYEKIKAGTAFSEAAKIYSDAPGATENGGQMPPVQMSDLAEQIRGLVAPLSAGEFTEPVETPAGFYIFYLEKKQFSGSSDFAKQKSRLEFELRSEELATQTQKWLNEQRRRSKINVIN